MLLRFLNWLLKKCHVKLSNYKYLKGMEKMIDIKTWMDNFLEKLDVAFGSRVWFIGLQGSYGRGEATETSDIDVVVVLDELSVEDIQTYNNLLDTLPNRDLICGFLSGKTELFHWEPSDLFQFYFDTTPIKGSLDELRNMIDETAVNRAIKIGACNIFHSCVHNMLYEKNEDILRGLYKSASFVIQAIAFKQTGKYISHQKDLLQIFNDEEKVIVKTFLELKTGGNIDFDEMSRILYEWSKKWIRENEKKKVAFICVHNSCRSQIAEALGKKLAPDVFESYSAGTETKPQINQDAVRIMKELYGIDMEQTQYSKLLADIPNPDVAISMGCNVGCPFIGRDFDDNWGLEDPTGKSDEEFKKIIKAIEKRIIELKERLS